jgi:hypothetical protein
MIRQSTAANRSNRLAKRKASPFSKQSMARAFRVMAPSFVAGIRMMSGRFQDAIPGLFGALFGAGVLGWGAGWIGSLTGQSM